MTRSGRQPSTVPTVLALRCSCRVPVTADEWDRSLDTPLAKRWVKVGPFEHQCSAGECVVLYPSEDERRMVYVRDIASQSSQVPALPQHEQEQDSRPLLAESLAAAGAPPIGSTAASNEPAPASPWCYAGSTGCTRDDRHAAADCIVTTSTVVKVEPFAEHLATSEDWLSPEMPEGFFWWICCDCRLTHRAYVKVVDGRAAFRFYNDAYDAALREEGMRPLDVQFPLSKAPDDPAQVLITQMRAQANRLFADADALEESPRRKALYAGALQLMHAARQLAGIYPSTGEGGM